MRNLFHTRRTKKHTEKNGNNIFIKKNDLLDACKNGNADNKKMFENLFGKEMFRPKNIMDSEKTFEDACHELGDAKNRLVWEYLRFKDSDVATDDILACLKLRIITAALNEGWTPQFTEDEYRYFPWFWLYTKEEIAKMDEEERKKVVLFGGLASISSYAGFSSARAAFGSRLCFKSSALAKYAGEQFAEIYFAFWGE